MNKTIKSIIGIFSILSFVAVASPALAVEGSVRDQIKSERQAMRADIATKKDTLRTDVKTERTELNTNIKSKIDSMRVDVKAMKASGATPQEIKAKVDEVKDANMAEREAFRAKIEEKRKTMKDEISKEINSFKEGKKVKLTDAAKAQVKQKLSGAFTKLSNAITKLAMFDKKVSEEIASRRAKGLDTSSAEAALELARRSLEEAKVTVASVNAAVASSVDSTTSASKEAVKSVINSALTSVETARTKYHDVLAVLPKVPEDNTSTTK